MADLAFIQVVVSGHVQGVFFRAFISRRARELGLTGYVRNLAGDMRVEVRAEGEKEKLAKLLDYLKVGPPGARVEGVTADWSEYSGSYTGFQIRY